MTIIAWAAAGAFFVAAATFFVDLIIKAPVSSGWTSDHFNGKTFSNPDNVKGRGAKDIVKWSLTGDPGPWREVTEEEVKTGLPPQHPIPDDEVVFTFVNHSTFLIQARGINILTDPIWSKRASPFQWVGPKRMRPPGIRFEDLPDIDLVLISHNHYDHLDINTVERLQQVFKPLFITPLGVSQILKNHGIFNAVELDWWEDRTFNDRVTVSGVPAQHFSGRGLSDRDKTLWCGYVVQFPQGNIYYAGDTGYNGIFKEIGRRFAPIHTALIPIGAYRPRWFMSPIHVDPKEAVRIHKDVNAERSIGMHFGTFPLADDGMHEPVKDLAKARTEYGLVEEEFRTLEEGESLILRPDRTKTAAE